MMIIPTVFSSSISSPVPVEISCSYRVPKWRRQLLPPENVLWHQPVHIVLPQENHCPCVIGPGCTRHEGQLPKAHYPHGRVHRKPWKKKKTDGRTEGKMGAGGGKGQGLVLTVGLRGSSPLTVACSAHLLTNEMCALSDYWFYAKLMMGVNVCVLCLLVEGRRMVVCPLVRAKRPVVTLTKGDVWGFRLMSHEIHDLSALYQLPPVKAVCKHRGRMLIKFIT